MDTRIDWHGQWVRGREGCRNNFIGEVAGVKHGKAIEALCG